VYMPGLPSLGSSLLSGTIAGGAPVAAGEGGGEGGVSAPPAVFGSSNPSAVFGLGAFG
jgi:hypothetical protein